MGIKFRHLGRGVSSRVRRGMGAFLKDEKGASGTEFAIVMLPMIFIFMFIIQFGMVLFVHNDMFNAARAGARQLAANETAVVNASGTTSTCGTADYLPNTVEHAACAQLGDWPSMTFQVTPTIAEGAPGGCDTVTVEVSTPMGDATVIDLFNIFSGLTLSADAVMRSHYDLLEGGAAVGTGACV